MKKILAFILAALLLLSLCSCSDSKSEQKVHKIGVIVYNLGDEEVIGFREYLQGYIEKNFEIVQFVYSNSIRSAEEELAFIQAAVDDGVEGFMSFLTYDLKAEVELCEKNQVYYLLASGTVSDEEFDSVADNPWFLGMFGPGEQFEYNAGLDMARHFAKEKVGDRYFILSGGASIGNEMHYQRTLGMLYGLCTEYGASFGMPLDELARTDKTTVVSDKGLTVTIVPGYTSNESVLAAVTNVYTMGTFDVVMATLNIGEFTSSVHGSKFGMVDSYNTRNLQLFTNGTLDYLVGKYSSSVGPAFALMLNAVTGYAGDFRDNGRAVKVTQGFWTSDSAEDYNEKYALSTSAAMNAYNFDDLSRVIRLYNPDADLNALCALAEACSYRAVQARRAAM